MEEPNESDATLNRNQMKAELKPSFSDGRTSWRESSQEVYINCMLDTQSVTWMAASTVEAFDADRRKLILPYVCIIRKFNRATTTCCKCSKDVLSTDIVAGIPAKDIRGIYGYITRWYHLHCALPLINRLCGLKDSITAKEDDPKKRKRTRSSARLRNNSKKGDVATRKDTSSKADEDDAQDEINKKLQDILSTRAFGFEKLMTTRNNVLDQIKQYLNDDLTDEAEPEIRDANVFTTTKDELVPISQPEDLLVPLLPFQLDGVSWMYNQERSSIRGGILADEMGMGKTIQTIALLLTNMRGALEKLHPESLSLHGITNGTRQDQVNGDIKLDVDLQQDNVKYKPETTPKKKAKKNKKEKLSSSEGKSMLNRKGGTLIVSPLAALLQWYNEIKTKTREGSLNVVLYYGPLRKTLREALDKYDVVLTTYAVVEAEFRKVQNKYKVACEHCGRIFMQKTLVLHQKYFCGPDALRTAKQRLTERKRDGGNLILKVHARLFPELKKIVDKRNEEELSTQLEVPAEDDDEDDDTEIEDYYSNKLLGINIIEAFATFGYKTDDIEKALEQMKEGTNAFMVHLKLIGIKSKLPNRDMFDLLEKFVASESLGAELFKGITVATLKNLLACLGLGSLGNKAELINKVIVFINKMRRFSANLNQNAEEPREHSDKTDAISPKRTKRLRRGGKAVIKEEDNEIKQEVIIKEEDARDGGNRYKPLRTQLKKEPIEEHRKVMQLPIGPTGETIHEGSVLHEIIWERIVIDEAHRIKTKSNSTSQAIIELRSFGTRWCLTGTPLQNRVGDVFSLITFLKFYPHAYNFCSKDGCTCELTKVHCDNHSHCNACGHSRINHYSYFNRHFLKPISNHGYKNEGQYAMNSLHENVFKRIMMRRTKVEKAKDVKLPPMHVKIRKDALSDFERDFYEALYTQSSIKFDTYAKSGTLLHNYAHIFDLLTRLRQAVDHPYLILYGPSSMAMKALNTSDPSTKAELEAAVKDTLPALGHENCCGICFEVLDNFADYVSASCQHNFHPQCLDSYLQSRPEDIKGDDSTAVTCPTCYEPFTVKLRSSATGSMESTTQEKAEPVKSKKGILDRIKLSEFKSSTKVEALLEELTEILTSTTDKCLVFSQYCSMLDIISFRLKTAQIQCAVLVGSTQLAARRNILLEFNNNPNLRVLLISLKAGGEGLNLQIANRIFIMDPWWNPASELQAIQRAHRIGQTKPVFATRFICKDTIEERIIELQEKKMIVFDATICSSTESMAKLSSEDLSFLFKKYN